MKENTQEHTNYFKQRLGEIGVPIDNARQHGLGYDENGNIKQYIRDFAGNIITYIPKHTAYKVNASGKRVKKNRPQLIEKPLFITRLHPEEQQEQQRQLSIAIAYGFKAKNNKIGKYRYPSKWVTGIEVKPLPTNSAIQAFRENVKGGFAVGIEGFFKATALSQCNIEATAFTGISTYKVCDSLKEYLLKRELNQFVIMYDGDALDISLKEGKTISSKRVFDFFSSAKRFSSQFYNFCKKNNLKTKLKFCMVNKDLAYKGVDDLLDGMSAKKEEILAELKGGKDGDYFKFLSLNSRNNEKNLKEFFGLTNHVEFYNRHAKLIKDEPFIFRGFKYKAETRSSNYDLFAGGKERKTFKSLFNPFYVDIEEEVLEVNKYMSEENKGLSKLLKINKQISKLPEGSEELPKLIKVKEQLLGVKEKLALLINDNDRLSIGAVTGIGKTAFFLGHFKNKKYIKGFFHKNDISGVIAVPTINLVKQLERKYKSHGVVGLTGFISNKTRLKAINSKVIICTYDTLHHVTDLWRRVLVVDESHNLVNQWGEVYSNISFRASVLNKVVDSFDLAKKTILISGTPNKLFAKKLDFKFVRIERKENNIVKVRSIESEANSYQSLTASTIAELEKIDFDKDNIHFVLYDSNKHLERIREHLITKGVLDQEEVKIIARDNVDGGDDEIYNQIISKEEIQGVKLVLCSCLIAEGININNTNIGNIYTVNVYSIDKFRQFVARFRKMAEVQVFDIKYPEKSIKKGFGKSCISEHDYLIAMAELQVKFSSIKDSEYVEDYLYVEDGMEEHDQVFPYYNDISNHGNESKILKLIYTTEDGVKVDKLKIFAAIKERETKFSNNTYFYTQIDQYRNIHLEGLEEEENELLSEIKSNLDVLENDRREKKKAIKEVLTNDLLDNGTIVVHSYLIASKKSKNRHAIRKILSRANNLIIKEEEVLAGEYYEDYKPFFSEDWYIKMINAYIKLAFLDLEDEVLEYEITSYSERRFNQKWKRLISKTELSIYNKRHLRKYLDRNHKIDIKIKVRLKGAINKLPNLTEIKSTALHEAVRNFFTLQGNAIVSLSDSAIDNLLSQLFNVESELFSGYKVFSLSELIPELIPNKSQFERAYIDAFISEKLHSKSSAVLSKKMASTG